MAELAVLASGSGSNFQAIAESLSGTKHSVCCLICDRKRAFVMERARSLGILSFYIPYAGRERVETEREIDDRIRKTGADLVVLAGFMKILSPAFIDSYAGRIVNIHPSLLPKYPGINAIEESYFSEDQELGVTIHLVDHGVDTGPVLCQKSFTRSGGESLEEIERTIHAIEHAAYPEIIRKMLDSLDRPNQEVM